ncbi:MAG: nucleotide sugar dehydrogenase [Siphonobacter sp.]
MFYSFKSPPTIAIIGLGYVGLPLAVEFGKFYKTIGFDISTQRIQDLKNKYDYTKEITAAQLENSVHLSFTNQPDAIAEATVYIIAVPTPVDSFKRPNLTPLLTASHLVGSLLKKGDVVIYESTVYPGCTEEDCIPVLKHESSLVPNEDFFYGYSPERINPGDSNHPLSQIRKVTSGSTAQVADFIDELYRTIILAGTFKASSIKVAEASKAIENAQRDVNISFVNELALLFDRLGIDTQEVLEAASTKWNFLNFKPGLVGGHCISVDPYYLMHKAESVGYYPQVLLSGRRINDQMGVFIANKVIKLMIKKGHKIEGSRALVLGITYKENCTDIRNTKVIEVVNELADFGIQVDVHDPWAEAEQVQNELGLRLKEPSGTYQAIILAVAHTQFQNIDWPRLRQTDTVVYDVKAALPKEWADGRL